MSTALLGVCRWSSEATISHSLRRRVCLRPRLAFRAVASRDHFRGAIPLLVGLPGLANRTRLVSLEAWDDWFAVRLLEHLPPREPASAAQVGGGGWFSSVGETGASAPTTGWEAATDVGSRHVGSAAGGYGGGQRHWLAVEFRPALPDDARSLTFAAGELEATATLSGWPSEERRLAVELGEARLGSTETRGDIVEEVVQAYSRGDEELVGVIPLNGRLGEVFDGHAWLLSIDVWTTRFDLHYRHDPFVEMDRPRLHGLWEASDDRGNRYVGFGNAATGREHSWFGVLSFAPALDPAASVLNLVLDGGLLRIETRLGH